MKFTQRMVVIILGATVVFSAGLAIFMPGNGNTMSARVRGLSAVIAVGLGVWVFLAVKGEMTWQRRWNGLLARDRQTNSRIPPRRRIERRPKKREPGGKRPDASMTRGVKPRPCGDRPSTREGGFNPPLPHRSPSSAGHGQWGAYRITQPAKISAASRPNTTRAEMKAR